MEAAAVFEALPFAAYAVCGLLVVLVQPGNRAAQLLLGAGVLLPLSRALEEVGGAAGGSWGRVLVVEWGRDAAFLLGLACLVATLSRFPDGVHQTRTESAVERVVGAAAVAATVGLLVPAVAEVARAIAGTEPLWALAGVGLLLLRFRRAEQHLRQQLRWPLLAMGSLAAVLVTALLSPGDPSWTEPLFMVALALFPLSLALGVATRARRTESDLLLSRTRLVTAQDEARRAIERDLHDGVQQQLVGVLSLVQLAQRQQERGDAEARATMQQVAEETQRTMAELRELASGIHPSVLTDCGLVDAVDSRLSLLPLAASLNDATSGRRWPPEIEAAAYFVVCEALTNAVKHARCERVEVDLVDDRGALLVCVTDDGTGLTAGRPGGGLTGLRDRVEALGGALDVGRGAAGGTVLKASFGRGRR